MYSNDPTTNENRASAIVFIVVRVCRTAGPCFV